MGRQRFRFEFRPPTVAGAALGLGLETAREEQAVLESPLPRMTPRDEAVYLLHATAEVEHALMVQYLYASFSLYAAAPSSGWAQRIFRIAVEEMGHLACVQNILLLIGGPINFEREDFPFRGDLYPFQFRLEPLTLGALAKYIAAERPAVIADPALDTVYRTEIEPLTREAADDLPVNRVGAVFERLLHLFRDEQGVPADDPSPPLGAEDFRVDNKDALATSGEWADSLSTIILGPRPDEIGTPQAARVAIRRVLAEIAQQGEGYASPTSGLSHFDRFIGIWQEYRQQFPNLPVNATGPGTPTRPVPTDPTPDGEVGRQAITHPRSRQWARLFNVRYRLLLAALQHYFEALPPFPHRGKLSGWAFDEMGNVKALAGKLMDRPQSADSLAGRAGPPFQLPYSLAVPGRERDRWRAHRDILDASIRLCEELIPSEPAGDREYLTRLVGNDRRRREQLTQLMNGQDPDAMPESAFLDLLKAKRATAQNRHAGVLTPAGTLKSLFQQEKYDDIVRFLRTGESILLDPNRKLIVPKKPDESGFFVQISPGGVMEGRFSAAEIEVVRNWILSLPDPSLTAAATGFAADIRPLFRQKDIDAMTFVFDLSKFEDVRDNAEAIHARLADGSMPCDAAWPAERIALFGKWIADGKQP